MSRRFQSSDRIGDYRVVNFIGKGGMGEVYHFYHERLNRSVAVKVLGINGSLDESYKHRFLNEARLQASLQHPNIATFFDFQEMGDELLIFMELVDGETLEDLCEKRAFSIEQSLRIFESIVSAIAFVHSNGVIHRDIKAENVKINSAGVPKLLDFGIAKDTQSQALTRVGGVIGTPKYLAPEQFDGKPASPQSDIWSLGILLYKILTGKTPFEGEAFEHLIFQIIHGNFSPPESIVPSIPKEVSAIVKKCLEMPLDRRYRTADELLRDVKGVLNSLYQPKFQTQSHQQIQSIEKEIKKPYPLMTYAIAGVCVFLLFFGLTIVIVTLSLAGETAKGNDNSSGNNLINIKKNEQNTTKNSLNSPQTTSDKSGKTVRVDSVGGSAEVWRNGVKIGETPLDIQVDENEEIRLQLKRTGFQDSEVPINTTKKVFTFSLDPK